MRLIAIETSDPVGSVAALADGALVAERALAPHQQTAQSLAPAVKQLLETVGWRPDQVEVVGVTVGPGSFTGLRIGLTTAKVFAYAVGADLVAVDTFEAIAAGCPPEVCQLAVAADAQRGDVVAGTLVRGDDGWFSPTGPWQLQPLDAWLATLPRGIALAGPGLARLAHCPSHLQVLERRYWTPTAGTVARLAARLYLQGRRDDLWSLVPKYYRPSAAEEKRESRRTD